MTEDRAKFTGRLGLAARSWGILEENGKETDRNGRRVGRKCRNLNV